MLGHSFKQPGVKDTDKLWEKIFQRKEREVIKWAGQGRREGKGVLQ